MKSMRWMELKKIEKGLIAAILLLSVIASASAAIGTASACGDCGCPSECLRTIVVTSGTSDYVRILKEGQTRYKPAVETWVHPLWPTIEGAAWISSSYNVEDPAEDSWRQFLRIGYIPGRVVSASINITADNAYRLFVNGKLVGSDGTVYGPGPYPQPWNWQSIEEYDLTSVLRPGLNCMRVAVRNYGLEGATCQTNPTGLIYRIDITYRVHC
jgi:hypothetical protein